jgi:hypothetical protein
VWTRTRDRDRTGETTLEEWDVTATSLWRDQPSCVALGLGVRRLFASPSGQPAGAYCALKVAVLTGCTGTPTTCSPPRIRTSMTRFRAWRLTG